MFGGEGSGAFFLIIVRTVHVVPGAAGFGSVSVHGFFSGNVSSCGLVDDDLDDLATCFDAAGRAGITRVRLTDNSFTTVSAGLFSGLSSLDELWISENYLIVLPDGIFSGLTTLTSVYLHSNPLTTVRAGIFDDNTSLSYIRIPSGLLCLPLIPAGATTGDVVSPPDGTCECELDGKSETEAIEILCGEDMSCEPGDNGYTCAQDVGGTGDPHMVGFSGQKFDFTGKDGSWYALLKDGRGHINMRVSAPLRELQDITYITGISMIVADFDGDMHTMSVYVHHPHTLESVCPVNVSPCLANGALRILLDGEELVSPGEVTLGRGVSFGAVNLPGECRPFGFERYWARKVMDAEEYVPGGHRRLQDTFGVSMAEWIVSDRLATNKPECQAYVEEGADDLFYHQSEHVSFQINTPTFTIRLNYGKLHQHAVRDPTDQFDLPDHLTHQMNLGLSSVTLGDFPEGILGETVAVRIDVHGNPIMTGKTVLSGNEEDYKVEDALGTSFKQALDRVHE